jgi:hypothetical protein
MVLDRFRLIQKSRAQFKTSPNELEPAPKPAQLLIGLTQTAVMSATMVNTVATSTNRACLDEEAFM